MRHENSATSILKVKTLNSGASLTNELTLCCLTTAQQRAQYVAQQQSAQYVAQQQSAQYVAQQQSAQYVAQQTLN